MAFKLVALFRHPKEGEATSGERDDDQMPFLRTLPGAQRVVVGTVVGSPRGDSPFARLVEVHFADEAAAKAALADPEVRARGRSVFSGQGKMKLMFVEEREGA